MMLWYNFALKANSLVNNIINWISTIFDTMVKSVVLPYQLTTALFHSYLNKKSFHQRMGMQVQFIEMNAFLHVRNSWPLRTSGLLLPLMNRNEKPCRLPKKSY